MRLKILLPTDVVVDEEVTAVTAEAREGTFCLLPRHIDVVTGLVPGLLSYETSEGKEYFLAIDEGILVKCGADVLVSTRNAVKGKNLGALRQTVLEHFLVLDDREKKARSAALKLEANLVRRFKEFTGHG